MKAIETALSLTQSYKLAIERLEKMLGEEFKSAVNVMQKTSEHIIVCGMGKSGLVGRKISSTLASTGTPSIFLHPAEAIHGDLGKVQKKSVVLLISYSGETGEILALIPALKRLNVTIIALTGVMIAGFIIFSGKLIASGEIGVNNFFSFLAAMMLAYQPIRSLATINMSAYQGAAAFKRISDIIDKEIKIKEIKDAPKLSLKNTDIKFKNIEFKYQESESATNTIFRDLTNRNFGDTDEQFEYDGGEFKIELPFENMMMQTHHSLLTIG